MFASFLVALPSICPVQFILEGMVEAQSDVNQETIDARATVIATKSASDNHYTIQVIRGKEARIDVNLTMSQALEESYYYRLADSGTVANAYRPALKQYTESRGSERDLASLVKAASPQLDEFLICFLTPKGLQSVLDKQDLKSPKWKISKTGSNVQLDFAQPDGSARFVVGRQSMRLLGLSFSNNLGGVRWTFKYSPLNAVKPISKEPGAYLVAQFDDRLSKMQVASGAAKNEIDRMLRHYDPPAKIAYELVSGETRLKAAYQKGYAYQSDAKAEWGYDGRTLTIKDKSGGVVYSGPASTNDVLAAVAACGSRVDPYLRGLMEGRNPLRRLLAESTGIDTKPAKGFSEAAVTASVTNRYADLKVTFAQKDGFVLQIESRPVANGVAAPKTVSAFKRIDGGSLKVLPPSNAKPLTELR